jgi:hypothetical protein
VAATTLGSLVVKLGLSTGAFSSGLSRAGKTVGGFTSKLTGGLSSIASAFNPVSAALAGVGLGLSAGGLAAFVSHQMNVIDANAKLADTFDISTEALAGLQHAGDLAGASSEDLTGGFTKLQNKIGEAVGGSTEAAAALAKVGLTGEQLKGMSLDQAFGLVADGLNKLPTAAERTAATLDLFGKSGGKLVPMLMGGSASLREAQAEAERFGLTVSRMDAGKVEEANDNWTRMGAAIRGAGTQLAIQFAPLVSEVGIGLADMFVQALPTIVEWGKTLAGWVGSAFTAVKFFTTNVGTSFDLVWTDAGVAMLGWWEDLQFIFTGKLPALFDILKTNWESFWNLLATFTKTVVKDMGTNFADFALAIPRLMIGDPTALASLLVPAIKRTMDEVGTIELKELKLPKRAKTETEISMQEDADRLALKLDEEWNKAFEEGPKKPLKPKEVAKNVGDGMAAAAPKFADLALAGSKEATEAISKFRFGDRGTRQERVEKIQQEQLREQRQTRLSVEQMIEILRANSKVQIATF